VGILASPVVNNLYTNPGIRKVYVAGPMRGLPDNNVRAFREAAETLRSRGLEVVSPVELDDEEGFDHTSDELTEEHYNRFLARDIVRILSELFAAEGQPLDALVMLPRWERSKGAALEVHIAREFGLPTYAYPDGERIKRPTEYEPPSDENILEEANRLIGDTGDEAYGHPLDDFRRTAKIATAVLDGYLKPGHEVQPYHIPLLMIGVKISRQVNNPTRRGWRSIAGYARTGEMVDEEIARRREAGELPGPPQALRLPLGGEEAGRGEGEEEGPRATRGEGPADKAAD